MCPRRRGSRLGGGKAEISYYVTPVRAGRVILEVGGRIEFEEVLPFLNTVAERLPFAAIAIDEANLTELKQQYARLQAQNINPVTYKRAIERNFVNCRAPSMTNEYDQLWFGKFE